MTEARILDIRQHIAGADRVLPPNGDGRGPLTRRERACPVTPLGHNGGICYFLDAGGHFRDVDGAGLANRGRLLMLFHNDEWLRTNFPKRVEKKDKDGNVVETVIVDFLVNATAQFLIDGCTRQGIWGNSVVIRQPGIWRGSNGLPIVHAGDAVLIDDRWQEPGLRTGNQIWALAEPIPRPAAPCGPEVARRLQADLQQYWAWNNPSAGVALLGLLHSGLTCGARQWRNNAFVTGPSGSGKSALERVIREAWPARQDTTDTTKAGIEQAINGRAVPVVIDEAADRGTPGRQDAARDLMDMVLSASGYDGTRLVRGTADGKGRALTVNTSVIMFSIWPPPMQPQHLGRFVLLELGPPEAGADYSTEHRGVVDYMREHAAGLWGRAIASFGRYEECLGLFRAALQARGCSARGQDGYSGLIAGWFVLTHDGLPSPRQVLEGVAALDGYIVTAEAVEADGSSRRAIDHLLSWRAELHRSSERLPIGELLDLAWGEGSEDERRMEPSTAATILAHNGIRVVRACAKGEKAPPMGEECRCAYCIEPRARFPAPRFDRGDQLYIANRSSVLDQIFRGTDFDGGRWLTALRRQPGAQASGRAIRIGGAVVHAVWLPRSAVRTAESP